LIKQLRLMKQPSGTTRARFFVLTGSDEQLAHTSWAGIEAERPVDLPLSGLGLGSLRAIYRAPRTSDPHPGHKIYPYLLRDLAVTRANQVWCTDISYIPMRKGFLYLVTIMDWHSRKVLSWRLSNTMDTDFCLEALNEALARYGRPDIFNSDQGSQFTSLEFTQVLKNHGVRISMDGRGRWRDNVYKADAFLLDLLNPIREGKKGLDHPLAKNLVQA
jgi:hypothetical protein